MRTSSSNETETRGNSGGDETETKGNSATMMLEFSITPDVCSLIASYLPNNDMLSLMDFIIKYDIFITAGEATELIQFRVAREVELEQLQLINENGIVH